MRSVKLIRNRCAATKIGLMSIFEVCVRSAKKVVGIDLQFSTLEALDGLDIFQEQVSVLDGYLKGLDNCLHDRFWARSLYSTAAYYVRFFVPFCVANLSYKLLSSKAIIFLILSSV